MLATDRTTGKVIERVSDGEYHRLSAKRQQALYYAGCGIAAGQTELEFYA